MNAYFLGLIVFAFVGSVVLSLSPEGMSKGYVRLLCGLCSVGCVAFPLFEFIGNDGIKADEVAALFEPYDKVDENIVEIYNLSLNKAAVDNAEEILKSEIIKELSAKYEDFDLEIFVADSGDGFYIDRIAVTIYPSGYYLDPKKISSICKTRVDGRCEFVYSK